MSHRDNRARLIAHSLAQQEQTARNLLRQAYALGWTTDEQVMAYAVEVMGEDAKPLVERVFAREFKTFNPN